MSSSKPIRPAASRRGRGAGIATDKVLAELLAFLSRSVERAQRGEPRVVSENPEPVKVWRDDEYDYLEAEIPEMNPMVEADLFLGNGIVFARIKRGDAAEPLIALPRRLNRHRA